MFYDLTIQEAEDGADEILKALAARKVNIDFRQTGHDAWEMDLAYDDKEAAEAMKGYVMRGHELFEQGYRLHESHRKVRGLGFDVPDDAIAWAVVSAGYIATTEAQRLQWVTKNDEDTTADDDAEAQNSQPY